ncbi:unnamed protein product [Cuscuta epithymum]|uniref:Uncharacterized protein n=1 Tax=Cuscuta epithymum TaxID=186058 RepID=A0AAV0E6C8_9ASTE|nr:unnamed protein product [Cuscuta epithymum]
MAESIFYNQKEEPQYVLYFHIFQGFPIQNQILPSPVRLLSSPILFPKYPFLRKKGKDLLQWISFFFSTSFSSSFCNLSFSLCSIFETSLNF